MPAGRKRLRRVAISIAALAALYFGGAFALSRFLDPDQLASWLEPKLEEALNREVEVGAVEVGFLPLGVTLRDLIVDDPTGLAPHLARITSLEFRVDVLPLLRREVRVSRLAIEALHADLREAENGLTNFGDFSSQGAADQVEESQRPFSLDLRGIRLTESRIQYGSAPDGLEAGIDGVELQATASQDPEGGWIFVGSSEGDLSLQQGEAKPLFERVPMELTFQVEADGEFDRLQIRAGELRMESVTLGLSGEVSHLQDPVRSVDLAMAGEGIPLTDLMAALPDSIRARFPGEAEGSLALNLRVAGEAGPEHVPVVTGQVSLTQGRVTLNGEPLVEALTTQLDLLPDRSVQAQVRGTLLDGPFSLEGTLATDDGMDLVLEADPDLGRLESVVELPEGMTASGRIPARVRLTGPIGDFRGIQLHGEVNPSGLRVTHSSLGVPLEVPEGTVQLSGKSANVQELPLILGEDRLSLTGELSDLFALLDPEGTPRLSGSVHGARLDLTKMSARPIPDSTLTYGRVAFAKVGGRPVAGRSFQEAAQELGLLRPDSLPVSGSLNLALDTVIGRRGRMERVEAQMDFGPDFLRVSDASFRRYGGEIRTAANLTLATDEAAPFSFRLQVQELDAGEFLSETTSLGRFVQGTISIELDLIGTLDGLLLPDRPALVGSGGFTLTGGSLASSPLTQGLADFLGLDNLRDPSIQDWGTSFILEQGQVRLADATVQGAPGSPRVGGSVGLDGGLDLQSLFSLPSEQLSTSALERLGVVGEMAAAVAQRPEVVQAILRIGGSVFDPAIQADPRAMAETLGNAVREEVSREAQEQLDAQKAEAQRVLDAQRAEAQRRIQEQKEQLQNRATGFLRGLVQGQDTVVSDTVIPDTLLPDTTRPDTVRPDTIRPDTVGLSSPTPVASP